MSKHTQAVWEVLSALFDSLAEIPKKLWELLNKEDDKEKSE